MERSNFTIIIPILNDKEGIDKQDIGWIISVGTNVNESQLYPYLDQTIIIIILVLLYYTI